VSIGRRVLLPRLTCQHCRSTRAESKLACAGALREASQAAILGFAQVWDAMEDAGKTVMLSARDNTAHVVRHKCVQGTPWPAAWPSRWCGDALAPAARPPPHPTTL
jgi:hypothetical protein